MKRLLSILALSILINSMGYAQSNATIVFHRITEPNERAFTLLVPKDWQTKGGIFRVNPMVQGGAAQSIAAKLDFAVMRNQEGSVMIRWLPDVLFFDMRYSPAGQTGLFPPGSNYNGMTVYPLMPAEQFIMKIAFPYAHPQATNVQVLSQKKLTRLAQRYQQNMRRIQPLIDFSYDAALIQFSYMENGQAFEERMLAVVENWGKAGAGLWGNKETFLIRTPMGQLKKWEPVLKEIRLSVIFNRQWFNKEIRGQMTRGKIMNNTLQEMQRIDQEITAHRQQVNAEINHDFFLTMTEQEEYLNPFTKQVETGSNQWQYRWENPQGDIIYTNQADYNPNNDVHLQLNGFKRTKIRKR